AARGWPRRHGVELFLAGSLLLGARLLTVVSFVPGFLPAFPFAIVGLFLAWREPKLRMPAAIAVLALPVVWATSFTGGASPQWGGRYVLTTSLLLGVAGIAALSARADWMSRPVAILCALVTLFGTINLVARSRTVRDGGA